MKKITVVILLSIFVFSAVGYEIVFAYLIYNYTNQIKNVRGYQEKTIVINSSNRDKLIKKNDHEIIFEGILYDIEKEEINGEKIIYSCIMDLKEQKLLDIFEKVHSEKDDNNKNRPVNRYIHKNFNLLYLSRHSIKTDFPSIYYKFISFQNSFYNQPILELPTQPPQFV